MRSMTYTRSIASVYSIVLSCMSLTFSVDAAAIAASAVNENDIKFD